MLTPGRYVGAEAQEDDGESFEEKMRRLTATLLQQQVGSAPVLRLALRWRWMPWLHLPAAAWGGFVELTGRICPLTPLENRLRRAAGNAGYEGDFIEHYLLPIIYPAGLTREIQFALAAVLIVLNAAIYAVVWRRRAIRRRRV